VNLIGYMVTCRLAFETGQIVGRKEDWLPIFREEIRDDWLPYLEEIYARGKQQWQYQIPKVRLNALSCAVYPSKPSL